MPKLRKNLTKMIQESIKNGTQNRCRKKVVFWMLQPIELDPIFNQTLKNRCLKSIEKYPESSKKGTQKASKIVKKSEDIESEFRHENFRNFSNVKIEL